MPSGFTKGEAPLVNDLLGGQVPVPAGIIGAGNAKQLSKKLRAIAVTGTQRSPLLPDVPTFAQSGVEGLEHQGWFGLFAPAGTPAHIVERVSTDIRKQMPGARARVAETGYVLTGSTPTEFNAFFKADDRFWKDTIRASGIRLE